MDFHEVLIDCNSYNTVFVNIDYLGKRVISIPYEKTITIKEVARCYGPVLDRNGRHSTRLLTDIDRDIDPALV